MDGYTHIFNSASVNFNQINSEDIQKYLETFHSQSNIFGFITNGDSPPDEEAIKIAKSINEDKYNYYIQEIKERKILGYGQMVPTYGNYNNLDSRHIMFSVIFSNLIKEKLNNIVEIGGGYGNLAYINRNIEFTKWTIIDIPHIGILQDWYLKQNNMSASSYNILSAYNFNQIENENIDLLIGTHSLSEFSLEIFTDYFNKLIKKSKYFLYSYHKSLPNIELINIKREMIDKYFNLIYFVDTENENVRTCLFMNNTNFTSSNEDTVSLFLTSCNRPQLLKTTLESFVKYNTYPIKYGVIVEDSGLQGINDFAHSIVPFPLKIIYTEKRKGQMKSIENGLQFVDTKYVFHCEEDWEFYNYGFIEESMKILKKNDKITSVWLRSHHDITSRYPIPLVKVDNEDYYICGPDIGNFSWNPGLRTIKVQKMFIPYEDNLCEGGLSDAFRKLRMTSAMTSKLEGYVHHIGWSDHVY